MDDFDDDDGAANIWARPSPELSTTTTKSNKKQHDDSEDAWNANSDDENDGRNAFVDAASKLDISQDDKEHDNDDDNKVEQAQAGPSGFSNMDDFDDDDDDFGEPAGAGAGDDDDDFGAFDEADANADFGDSFTQPEAGPSSQPAGAPADEDYSDIPTIDFSKIGTTQEEMRMNLEKFWTKVYPDWKDSVDPDIPEPKYEGKESILVDQYSRDMYHKWLETPPEFELFDWKRSSIRRNMMQSLGIPVNLDDLAPPKAMPSLVLPAIHTTPASPSKSTSKNPLASSAPPSSIPVSNGSSISRSASPARPQIPEVDVEKAQQLASVPEDELKFKTLAELEKFRNELQEIAIQASTHLTALLERKETLTGQSETYNTMIQDLVREAQKMRSPSNASTSKSSVKRSSSTSSRTGASNSISQAPAAGRTPMFGGSNSRPTSRPASPAPQLNVKTGVARSSAAMASSPSKESRRSSLW